MTRFHCIFYSEKLSTEFVIYIYYMACVNVPLLPVFLNQIAFKSVWIELKYSRGMRTSMPRVQWTGGSGRWGKRESESDDDDDDDDCGSRKLKAQRQQMLTWMDQLLRSWLVKGGLPRRGCGLAKNVWWWVHKVMSYSKSMCKVSEEIKNEIMQADEGDGCWCCWLAGLSNEKKRGRVQNIILCNTKSMYGIQGMQKKNGKGMK